MAMELLDVANKNFSEKLGSEEHSSLLPEMQNMIMNMYSIEKYNFVFDERLLPNLDGYNISYDGAKLKAVEQSFLQKSSGVNQNEMGITR